MTLSTHETEIDVDGPGIRVPQAWLAAGDLDCECPDRCPVQHDDN
jgi:hypothetical protein